MSATTTTTTAPIVLVTGGNGFVGTATVLELIKQGYKVKATVRRQSSADAFNAKYPDAAASIEWVLISSLTDLPAMTAAAHGVDYMMHLASPYTLVVKDPVKDMLVPAIDGTLTALRAAKANPRITRVVLTSSFAAMNSVLLGLRPGHTYSEADWNPATWEQAASSDHGGFIYCASKELAEHAAWEFMDKEKPGFTLSVFNPPMVYGPPLQPFDSLEQLNESVNNLWQLLSGNAKEMPFTGLPIFVDVRDLAHVQVAALKNPAAANQRYFTVGGAYTFDDVVRIAARAFPEQGARMTPVSGHEMPEYYGWDNSKIRRDFGIEFTPLEKTVTDMAKVLYEAEAKFAKSA